MPAKQKKQEEEAPEAGGCPAAVLQLKPALPGTVNIVAPLGTQLAQRPFPPAAEGSEVGAASFLPTEVPTSP